MPAEQRGSVYKVRGGFGVRWTEHGRREHYTPSPPFPTKTAARAWFSDEIRPRLRRGSPTARATLAEFVDAYLAALAPTRDPGTLATLRDRLGVAGQRSKARTYDRPVERFGDVPLRDLEGFRRRDRGVADDAPRGDALRDRARVLAGVQRGDGLGLHRQ